ncbi:MAG: 50S ribosomal protein L15 [Aestuariivirgaceae bacterium]
MRLNQITDKVGARHARKRVARGIGSGLGKTAGRGGKGQTARSGGAKPGFEGGQMPIYRRLPKRGFNKPNAVEYNEINLGRVQAAFDAKKLDPTKPVTLDALVSAGVISHPYAGVRLLGQGEIKVKAAFEVYHASKGAQAAIEKMGGSVKTLRPLPEAKNETKPQSADKAKQSKKTAPAAESKE